METVERLLREEFGAPDSTVALERGPLIEGVRRVRRRRRMLTTAAATALMVVAGFGAAQLIPGPRHSPPIGADNPGYRTVLEPPEFISRERGFVVAATCEVEAEGQPSQGAGESAAEAPDCRHSLKVTDDAGRTWQDRPLPGGSDLVRDVEPFDGNTLVVRTDDERWLSRDGGRTWTAVTGSRGTATTIPAGGHVEVAFKGTDEPEGLDILAPDGTVSRLSLPPDLTLGVGFHPARAATDGSFWVPCTTAAKEACVAYSRDNGRSWEQARFNAQPPLPAVELTRISTIDGRTILADVLYQGFASGSAESDDPKPTQHLWRSADGGQNWQPIELPAGRHLGAEVLPNGDAIADFDGRVFRLPAGGTAFQPVPGTPRVHFISRTGPWLHGSANPDAQLGSPEDKTLMSPDGTVWTELKAR